MKFYGAIGYAEGTVETSPGSGRYKDHILERDAYGDVIRNTRQLRENTERINDDIVISDTISVVADAYLSLHFFAIRYVVWQGVRWKVTNVEVQRPRLNLSLGSVYNGPLPT